MRNRLIIAFYLSTLACFSQTNLKTLEFGPFHRDLNWTGMNKEEIEMTFKLHDPNNSLQISQKTIGDTLIYYFNDGIIRCRKLTFNQKGFNVKGYCDFDQLVFHSDSIAKKYFDKVLAVKTYGWKSVNNNRSLAKETWSLDLTWNYEKVSWTYYTITKKERKALLNKKS